MTTRLWAIGMAFLICLSVVLAAMGWISLTAFRLDCAESLARAQATHEENVRLALWRMDTAIAPILANESARPYFAYRTFLPADRGYGELFLRGPQDAVLLPSPLLADGSPHVLVYFQFEPDGSLHSPHVPWGSNYGLAVPSHVSPESFQSAERHLTRLQSVLRRDQLMAILPASDPAPVEVVFSQVIPTQQERVAQRSQRQQAQRKGKGAVEFLQRNDAVAQMTQSASALANQNAAVMRQAQPGPWDVSPLRATDLGGAVMKPIWIGGQLLLARRISAGGAEYVQGCWLDWPEIKGWLLETVEDLVPAADLEPLPEAPDEEKARMLAALPVALDPGPPPLEGDGGLSPLVLSLAIAWACVIVSAVAVAALLWGVVRLSQRRAAFVSAVTHELRTPLTTFHMYTEMLAEGMVPDLKQQQDYIGTLRAEASRLSHLVENVLSYARLERGRADGRIVDIPLGDLVDGVKGRLAERAEHGGMQLVVDDGQSDPAGTVRVNPSAVEQILFNLVDNACKYAHTASDRRIHLAARQTDGAVELSVRDHGPGITQSAARRLFHPFSKSAQEAAQTAPGIGLGLALSRRLARDMDGHLRLDSSTTDGAHFILTIKPRPETMKPRPVVAL